MKDSVLETLKVAVVEGDDTVAADKSAEALAQGVSPTEILNSGIVPGIEQAGELWKANKYFLPDVIMSAEAFKAAMKPIEPLLKGAPGQGTARRFVIGVVQGDMHDLGKSLVTAMLASAGFEVTDLGVDVSAEKFINTVRELKPDIVGLGAYMTTTMLQMKEVIAQLEKQGLRDHLKVMVGGVPTSQEFANQVGADAWGKDAMDAVHKAHALVGG